MTINNIEEYLESKLFDNPQNLEIRKAIVNTFIREIILYEDRIVITYNFADSPEPHEIKPNAIKETEKQIDAAFSQKSGLTKLPSVSPLIT